MAKRQTLGRGLSALFGEAEASAIAASADDTGAGPDATAIPSGTGDAAAPASGVRQLPVDRLSPSPLQPRRVFDEAGLDELAESVRHRGVLQPLLVRPRAGAPDQYEIIAGERRWRAAQRAQVHQVPVLVRDFTDRDTLEVALVENLQRQDLNPMEEAEGYRRLVHEFDHTQEALAEAVGKSRSHVANTMRLLTLPEEVRGLLNDGALTAGHARALLTLEHPTQAARDVVRKGLNVRQTETLAREMAQRPAQARPRKGSGPRAGRPDKDADTLALERDLSAQLGMAVSIDMKAGGGTQGTVTVQYASLSQLDEILARLSRGPSAEDGDDITPSPFG
ncbi:ParB/RepB/Spo0J family partition protein [Roseospira visakhapatnamensis]|uniref:ParB family chromosome partitioning protein n=1 Tax=Roseospira visakhapatnamensis TaxID=390880 RepID=A0A7W6R9S7_9PROT|nr:ParB/RepB/Spo0J family partition protein [Roseospira visakhapatnamensis]MBB4264517.1 ParB family chromosome partitioning protein [Roseospira visakhapatnamensis]